MTDHTLLICIEDQATRDILRAAIRQFPSFAPHDVPLSRIQEVVSSGEKHGAVIIDLHPRYEKPGETVLEIRALDPDIELLCLIEKGERERHNRLKMEARVFSFVPTPIEPFDLARRLHRLQDLLITGEKTPSKQGHS